MCAVLEVIDTAEFGLRAVWPLRRRWIGGYVDGVVRTAAVIGRLMLTAVLALAVLGVGALLFAISLDCTPGGLLGRTNCHINPAKAALAVGFAIGVLAAAGWIVRWVWSFGRQDSPWERWLAVVGAAFIAQAGVVCIALGMGWMTRGGIATFVILCSFWVAVGGLAVFAALSVVRAIRQKSSASRSERLGEAGPSPHKVTPNESRSLDDTG